MNRTSPSTIQRRLKEGRGQGSGPDYRPWLNIRDVPSRGLSCRVKGSKTGRLHSFLSRLETDFFFLLEGLPAVSDLREQFPLLPIDETIAIADECGVAHPADPRIREPIVMTTDFVVTMQDGSQRIEVARSLKYSVDLAAPRTLEKLEIERRYWDRRGIEWAIVTEKDISPAFVKNIRWLHPYLDVTEFADLSPANLRRIELDLISRISACQKSLACCAAETDDLLGLKPGTSLSAVRHFLATRRWQVDLYQPIDPNRILNLAHAEPSLQNSYELFHQHAA